MNAAIPERKPATEEIAGLMKGLAWHNEENCFGKRTCSGTVWRLTDGSL